MRSKSASEKSLLATYRAKRHFDVTPEPTGSARVKPEEGGAPRFVIQKHDASHLHYDFRLEADGVLKSWAVPKGPTLDPGTRRLAMQVEDHPLDYFDFEGSIPAGNYGAGEVIVWDWGTYETVDGKSATEAIAKGRLKIRMHGEKLHGVFALVRMHGKGSEDRGWLLIKDRDEAADPSWTVDAHAESVKTGRTLDDIRNDPNADEWHSNRTKHGKPKSGPAGKVTKTAALRKAKKHAKAAPLPHVVTPMLATLIDAPFDGEDWLFEIKWDGFRALATIDEAGAVTLVSRNGKDLLSQFPSLERLAASFRDRPVMVDGEIVALDAEGKSSFQRLQNRLSRTPKVTYVVFDVLYAEGRDLRGEPLEARKAVLEKLVIPGGKDVLYSAHVVGNGTDLFRAASEQGLEGIIGKRRGSTYVEKRTRDWVKIKAQKTQECVIAGYTEPTGARNDIGSLVLGTYEKGVLTYAGNVGTGFTQASLKELKEKLLPLATDACPFAVRPKTRTRAHWVKPKLVAQIRFTEWTEDGSLRHPAFLGLRDDKKPAEVTREREAKAPAAPPKKRAVRRAKGAR